MTRHELASLLKIRFSDKGGRFGENKVDSIQLKTSIRINVAITAGFIFYCNIDHSISNLFVGLILSI